MEREAFLSSWWGMAAGATVSSPSGAVYTIRYPGRLNGSAGPDYRGAVLDDGSRTLLGDVELHVHSSDWRRHGHDSDHAYDGVVLHVVLDDDSCTRTTLASGAPVPVAVADIGRYVSAAGALPCADLYSMRSGRVVEVLETQGIARLLLKGRHVEAEIRRTGEQREMLRLVARSLGYSSNAGPCEEVARLVSDSSIADCLKHCDAMERRALVLGIAGLLPSQRHADGALSSGESCVYEVVWRGMGIKSLAMRRSRWRLGCIYPNNHPVRRMIGLADLLPTLPDVMDKVRRIGCEEGQEGGFAAGLEPVMLVAGDPYWRTHYDFGRTTHCSNVVGRGKAREIVVNALVPLAFAVATSRGGVRSLARLAAALRAYPACQPNAVTKHMSMQLGMERTAIPALQTQGMLRIFTTYCTRGLCEECPLGKSPIAL